MFVASPPSGNLGTSPPDVIGVALSLIGLDADFVVSSSTSLVHKLRVLPERKQWKLHGRNSMLADVVILFQHIHVLRLTCHCFLVKGLR